MTLDESRTPGDNSPLRVLAYADSPVSFGAEAVFLDVVEALARAEGLQVAAAVSRDNPLLWDAIAALPSVEQLDVPPHPPGIVARGVWDPRRGRRIRRALGGRRWDVALVNLPSAEFGSAPLLWARSAARTRIGLLHLHQSLATPGRPAGRVRDRLARWLLHSSLDHVLVISPSGPTDVARNWGFDQSACTVLPLLRRTPERLDPARSRELLGIPRGATAVGMVGRIDIGQKGHDTFVAAAKLLARDDEQLVFAIVGEGPDEGAVRAQVTAAGLEDRFLWPGTIRPADAAFAALDAIAFPSRFEGLPLTAIEALAAGLPGVASRVDGLAAAWPGEWTVTPDDPAALAERLAAVLNTPPAERGRRVAAAAAAAAGLLADDIEPILSSVIASMAGRGAPVRPAARRTESR